MFVVFCGRGNAGAGENKFVPPDGKILVFAGQSTDVIDDYVKTTQTVPAGFMVYTSVQQADGLREPADYGGGECHGQYLVDKYPGTALQIGLYMVDALDDVVSGNYDRNIDDIGRWIAATKRPVYLRIGYEFDGPHNHYDPKKYVKAYRYIVNRFRKKKIDNVAYVWHSYASTLQGHTLLEWYPGDEYVDWFGISYFNQHPGEMKPMILLAREHRKPVMIAESTPATIGTAGDAAWKRWFQHYFEFIAKNDIKAFSYINCDWDNLPMFADFHWRDARLASSDEVKEKWNAEIAGEKYLHSSPALFDLIGFAGTK
jgi:hypothetical protein